MATIIALKEIKQCLAIFPEKSCTWALEQDGVHITVPEGETVAKMISVKKKKQKKAISLNDAFVTFPDSGTEVRAYFKRQVMGNQPQSEFDTV